MENSPDKFDLMVLIIIVIFGMAAAYLALGILSSQAKIESGQGPEPARLRGIH
jgi:hypothetical protein